MRRATLDNLPLPLEVVGWQFPFRTIRLCQVCLRPISQKRLKALPQTTTCLTHSNAVSVTEAILELDGSDPADLQNMVQNVGEN